MNDLLISWIRTTVPGIVAAVIGWASSVTWLHALVGSLSDTQQAQVSAAAVAVALSLYYALVRLLEQKWPAAGVFLGHTAQPSYSAPSTAVATAVTEVSTVINSDVPPGPSHDALPTDTPA